MRFIVTHLVFAIVRAGLLDLDWTLGFIAFFPAGSPTGRITPTSASAGSRPAVTSSGSLTRAQSCVRTTSQRTPTPSSTGGWRGGSRPEPCPPYSTFQSMQKCCFECETFFSRLSREAIAHWYRIRITCGRPGFDPRSRQTKFGAHTPTPP